MFGRIQNIDNRVLDNISRIHKPALNKIMITASRAGNCMVGNLPAVSYKLQLEGNRCKLCVRTCVGSPYGRDYYQAYSKACATLPHP